MNFLQVLFATLVEKVKAAYDAIHDRVKYGSSGSGMNFSFVAMRDAANRNPAVLIGIVLLGLAIGGGYYVKQTFFSAEHAPPVLKQVTRWYYTTDDGATYFPDDSNKITPFQHDGRPAIRARVFSCDGGKTRFVGYVERQTAALEKALPNIPGQDRSNLETMTQILQQYREIKPPRTPESAWSGLGKPAYAKTLAVHCPDGPAKELEEVFP